MAEQDNWIIAGLGVLAAAVAFAAFWAYNTFVPPASASPPTNVTITLTVESSAAGNAPINGASVVWTSASTGTQYPGTSNADGVCAVTMPAGLYYVDVSASGYTAWDSSPKTEECTTSWSAPVQLTPT